MQLPYYKLTTNDSSTVWWLVSISTQVTLVSVSALACPLLRRPLLM